MADTTTTQIVRESPEVEALRLGLVKSSQALKAPTLPKYQVAGLSDAQLDALRYGAQGIGAYQPYLTSAGQYLGSAQDYYTGGLEQGLAGLTKAQQAYGDYRQADLGPSQQYMTGAVSEMGKAGPEFGQAQQYMTGAVSEMGRAGPEFGQAQDVTQASIEQARLAATQPGYAAAEGTLGRGVSALGGTAAAFTPTNVEQFMNPYQQQVIDESLRQIGRQNQMAQMGLQAQAVRSGAFGGSREGVQRAELGRGLAEAQNAAIVGGLSSGYQSAMQQAMQAFEAQKQRQLAQAQGYQAAANLQGSLATQQGQLGLSAAQMAMQGGQQLGALEAQRSQYAQNAARYRGDIGQQLGALEAQRSQYAQNAARYRGDIGQQLAQQQLQQAQLGQNYAQNLASIAGQRFSMGAQTGAGLGSLATQYGTLAGQQQAMGQQDVNFLYGLGAIEQQQKQRELDALRQSKLQEAYSPYQHLAFQSDIYKGAPSSQMAFSTQMQPTPSWIQQGTGLITGGISTAAAAKQAGVF